MLTRTAPTELSLARLLALAVLGEIKGQDAGQDEHVVLIGATSTLYASRMVSQCLETVATVGRRAGP
jgi:hypothetical protein